MKKADLKGKQDWIDWRTRRMNVRESLFPAGHSRLWLYTGLLDHPDLQVVFRAARAITQRFQYAQVQESVWKRAKRRMSKYTVDGATGEPVAVDPLFRVRGGCRRGRPSRLEQQRAAGAGIVGEILGILEEEGKCG